MEFPHRSGDEGHHHHPHPSDYDNTEKTHAMFPHRGAEEGHHHHPHYYSRPEEQAGGGHGYEHPSVYEPKRTDPYAHPSAPFERNAPPAGPYGTHDSSGPYYPHPHHHELHPTPAPFVPEVPSPHHHQPLLPQGQLVRVFCQKNQAFNLAVEHNNIIMKAANTEDEAQQWIKDESYGMRIKDNYGYSAFSLVNKKTGKILKHPKAKGHQVLLMEYRPDIKDDDILWSESQDFGEGFKTGIISSGSSFHCEFLLGQL
ncbi:hypothetical protein GOP47_0027661 [Adiantum capillus-veneris]|nr:hypothetical protein GOP47_0027661 [Adiantum capillus-veneris]